MHAATPHRTTQPRTRRPIHQRPSLLESIFERPIRVECWTCIRPSWLHRNQKDASPSDWTCPNCLTHQRRDIDGNVVGVPEMYDGTLNEDVAERVAHSLKSRKRPTSNPPLTNSQNDFFCEMCNGHQRVVYQLLSNYIPDEEDENYEAYYDNAETYRRQLEERYPLACARCLDRVQKELAQQNSRIKSSLLNATLNKSRGDRISPTRKYPTAGWIVTGCSWLCAHTTLLGVEILDCFGSDFFPRSWALELPRHLALTGGGLTLHDMLGGLSKFNLGAVLPWSSTFGKLFSSLSEKELSAIYVLALTGLSLTGLCWDPLHFSVRRTPRVRIRMRQYYSLVQMGALPLLLVQLLVLFSSLWQLELAGSYGITLALHLLYIWAFFNGKYTQEPLEFKLDNSSTLMSDSATIPQIRTSQADRRKPATGASDEASSPSRFGAYSSDHLRTPTGVSLQGTSGSRPSSPETSEINWSPRKPASTTSARLPAAFGMYRDTSQTTRQDDGLLQAPSRSGSAGSFREQGSVAQDGFSSRAADSKFRSRAYEPSPLANPSLITNMGLNNISLGEMLGFPSAKFQPPENHFAHRSGKQPGSDTWSYRKPTATRSLGSDRPSSRYAAFSESADVDMDEDELDFGGFRSAPRRAGRNHAMEADAENDLFSSFGRAKMTDRSDGGWTSSRSDAFAAQRYFPPEPETGLEDNFFGIVKIVDDYLPPQQGPRSISGRNLMLKKRMARRWFVLIMLCRCNILWKGMDGWARRLDWASQVVFAGVMFHATAFWLLDESRALRRRLSRKGTPVEARKAALEAIDPFEPTKGDSVCSYLLLVLLGLRTLNIGLVLAEKASWAGSGGWLDVMDWSPRTIWWFTPWLARQEQWAVETQARLFGLAQDSLVLVLLAVLMAFGAGQPSDRGRVSKYKDKETGKSK